MRLKNLCLGVVNELACRVRIFPSLLSGFCLNSIRFLVCAALTEAAEARCPLPHPFHLLPSGTGTVSGQRKSLPWHFLIKLSACLFFPGYHSPRWHSSPTPAYLRRSLLLPIPLFGKKRLKSAACATAASTSSRAFGTPAQLWGEPLGILPAPNLCLCLCVTSC